MAGLLMVALVAVGLVGETAGAAPVPVLQWADCGGGFQCATATVPMDYRKPQGSKVELALIRKPALDQAHRIGSLFMNPGGPGGSGVEFVRTAPSPAFQLLSKFDVIGFDPRGVGASKPGVDCGPGSTQVTEPIRFPRPPGIDQQAVVREVKERGECCVKKSGDILAHLSTANVARDLDLLRAAVGDSKLNYYGLSYGTVIGATYASMYPGKGRALLLDSPVDAQTYYDRPFEYGREQAVALEDVLDRFFAACTAARCGFGGSDPETAFDALVKRLNATPLPSGDPQHPAPVTGDEVLMNAVGFVYRQADWRYLADALTKLEAGDPSAMVELTGANGGFVAAAGSAVLSVDQQFSHKLSEYAAEDSHVYGLSRNFWFSYGTPMLIHGLWPVEDHGAFRGKIRNKSGAQILVIGGRYDPATPYNWSERLTADLGNARLLTFRSTGHGAVPTFNACVLGALSAYFETLALPPVGAECVDNRPPFSTAAAAAPARWGSQ